mmetsp:Transcript_8011/g.12960  ORF Transcript_8011/g.12960 Transcript_8011/m.12960 type:complete len:207 (+) Transcript_8011:562-1182(+)
MGSCCTHTHNNETRPRDDDTQCDTIIDTQLTVFFESHEGEKHGNYCKLPKHTSVHDLHLRLEMLLSLPPFEYVQDSRHSNRCQNLKRILLPKIGNPMMHAQHIPLHNSHTRIHHALPKLLRQFSLLLFVQLFRLERCTTTTTRGLRRHHTRLCQNFLRRHFFQRFFVLFQCMLVRPFCHLFGVMCVVRHFVHGVYELLFGGEGECE